MASVEIKTLVGKAMTKEAPFMNGKVTINKLSVAEVMEIQEISKELGDDNKNDEKGFEVLKTVIRNGVEGGTELSDEDFDSFPLSELSNLSNEIMKFSGLGVDAGK